MIFSQDGDNIVMKIKTYETTTKSVTLSFKLGEEFDENTIDFRYCKVSTLHKRLPSFLLLIILVQNVGFDMSFHF